MPLRPRDVAEMISELVPLPEICMHVNEMASRDDCSVKEISAVISADPALTTRLLRLANSPFYGFSNRIDTVQRAVMVIGTQGLRDLVVAAYAVDAFSRVSTELVDLRAFWRHSMFCGLVTRQLAARMSLLHRERLFVAGLLHDVGKLAMYSAVPELVEVILARFQVWDGPLYRAEESILGFHHGHVGAELMAMWRLPECLQHVAAGHHHPDMDGPCATETALVHLANNIANLAGYGDSRLDDRVEFLESAWEHCRLSEELVDGVIAQANVQLKDVMSSFLPATRSAA